MFSNLLDEALNVKFPTDLRGIHFDRNDERQVVEYELPGFKKSDVSLKLVGNVLDVVAKTEKKDKSLRLYVSQLVDKEAISSTLEDGLLKIVFPFKKDNKREIVIT